MRARLTASIILAAALSSVGAGTLDPAWSVPLLFDTLKNGINTGSPAKAAIAEGEQHLDKNDLAAAEKSFKNAVTAAPLDPVPLLGVAEVAMRQGRSAEAEASLKRALSLGRESAMVLVAWARFSLSVKEYERAVGALEQALTLDPLSAILHQERGDIYGTLLNNQVKAEEAYREAIALDAKNAATHYGLGNTLLRLGKLSEAKIEFGAATNLTPDNALAWSGLGAAHLNLSEWSGAERAFATALKRQPSFLGAQVGLGDARAGQGNFKGAMQAYELAVKLDGRAPIPRVRLGVMLQLEGRVDEAEGSFRDALAINPKDPEASNNLAFVLAERGTRLAEALRLAQAATATAPDNLPYRDTLAWVHRARGEREAALSILQDISARVSNPDFFYHLGVVYAELDRVGEAAASFDRVLMLAPNYQPALDARGKLSTAGATPVR